MAQLTITIPNEQVARVLEAFGARMNASVGGTFAPATPEQVRQQIVAFVKQAVLQYEAEKARVSAISSIVEVDAS